MENTAHRQIVDIFFSVLIILFCSMIGLIIGSIMHANWQEKQWAMLYSVVFVGSLSSFFCLIKLSQIFNLLIDLNKEGNKKSPE